MSYRRDKHRKQPQGLAATELRCYQKVYSLLLDTVWERQINQLPVCPLRNLQADHSDTVTKNHYARRGETVQITVLVCGFCVFLQEGRSYIATSSLD